MTTMRSRTSFIALVLATVVGACGGSTTEDGEPASTESVDASDNTTATSDPGGAEETEETGTTRTTAEPETDAAPAAGAGTANLTIGDMTLEFTGLTCYYDDDAAEAYGDEDATFAAVAQDGDAIFFVVVRDMAFDLFEVAYIPGDETRGWHMSSTDVDPSYLVEDGRIAAEGDFDLFVETSEEPERTEPGTLDASCG